jgi:hypothetical protein
LLTWVPFLRRRLFSPFRASLVADARITEFREDDYFLGSMVRGPNGRLQCIAAAIRRIRGQIILEGESGLGKTMFLKRLARDYDGLVVFLRAIDCELGVLEAIQKKLHGMARDPEYLTTLIYAGAMDIIIDGVNEVSAETRVAIVEFAKHFFKGNLLMSTQPLAWDAPPLARTYILLPLEDEKIETFLIGRFRTGTEDAQAPISEEDFAERCQSYVQQSLSSDLPPEKRNVARSILSNPMDLTIVARMLIRNETPSLFDLMEQNFGLVSLDYRKRHGGSEFRLRPFAERVYQMRVYDEPAFAEGGFSNELTALAQHKMVVPFHNQGPDRTSSPHWTFRHDRIRDFFLVKAFLGVGNVRPKLHLGDARFRGVYLQLVNILPVDAAESLERMLIDYAADTRDHTVSDDFVQLLRVRKAA